MHSLKLVSNTDCGQKSSKGFPTALLNMVLEWGNRLSSMGDRMASRMNQGPVPPYEKKNFRPEHVHRTC